MAKPLLSEVRAVLAKHCVWKRQGRASDSTAKATYLYNAYMRIGDVKPELAPVEPFEEGWTRMDVDDRDHDERDEAEQSEELKRVLAARQLSELERQKHFSDESCCVRTLV